MIKRVSYFGLCDWFFALCSFAEAQQVIFLVRHTEQAPDDDDPALTEAGQRRAQALAQVLKDAGINVQQTENVVFEGATAAIARIHLDQEPPAETLDGIRAGSKDILELSVVPLG